MIASLNRFLLSQGSFFYFFLILGGYISVFLLRQTWDHSILSLFQLLSGGFFFLFGTGACVTLILQWLFKKTFDAGEFLSLSFFMSFLISPLLLNLEFSLLKSIANWHPIINIFLLLVPASILLFFKKTTLPSFVSRHALLSFYSHPLFLAFVFGIIFLLLQVFSFSPLPDLDPYKWLYKYTYQFENHLLDYAERPFFGSLIFAATALTGITIAEFFKYFLPLLLLTALIPGWLVAKTFPDKSSQWIFLFFLFSIPNVVLYAGTAMPQAPFIVLCYFITFFLLYSYLKHDDFFLYASGVAIFLAFFYHQTALLMLPAWILPVIIAKRKAIFGNKKILLLLTLILLGSLQFLKPLYEFGLHWIYKLAPAFLEKAHFNWFYPAQYSNVDRNLMGWSSLSGIIKFYAYYVGPVLGLILLSFLLLSFHKKFRSFVLEKLFGNPALSIIFLSFLTFFIIAEVFPRFPGVALLPDRAWVFAGIFGYIFLFLLLQYFPKISSKAAILFTACFLLAISGTLYINYLKRYLISPLQLESAEWIKTTLPENRLFLSYGYRGLLPVYAESTIVNIPNEVYCETNYQSFEKTIQGLETSKRILTISPLSVIPTLTAPVSNKYIYTLTPLSSLKEKSLYIYYSQVHTKNPYRDRPYSMKSWGIKPCSEGKFLFDQFPQKFERVYQKNDDFDEVIIWKVL